MVRGLIGVSILCLFATAALAADGAAVFKGQCAKCHGETGQSDTTVGKAMKVPALAGDAKIQKASEDEILALIKGNTKHPPTVKTLSDDDMKAAAGFVKGLAGK